MTDSPFRQQTPDLAERLPFQNGHRDFPCSRGGLMWFSIKDLPCTSGFFFKAWINSILRWVSITPLGGAY